MKLAALDRLGRPVHLTYCTNIHPAESWLEVFDVVKKHVMGVKQRVSPQAPFGVGLRLSARAAETLANSPTMLLEFKTFLEDNELYVFTLNGFPYGPFHGQPVKEQVYRPDWLEPDRVQYTRHLAAVLAALLPHPETRLGRLLSPLTGSISTVPGCFRGRAAANGQALSTMAENLRLAVADLARIFSEGGPSLGLALEPEPHCVFETTAELLRFFEEHLFTEQSAVRLSELTGLDRVGAAEALRRHLGICLDACHAAVEYETPAQTLTELRRSGVTVFKLQVSAGLRIESPTPAALTALQPFVEGVYLHQTVVRRKGVLVRHCDLPDALTAAAMGDTGEEWRIHFHVPLFAEQLAEEFPGFSTTASFLRELLSLVALEPVTAHLEVETYTWDVLPQTLRTLHVDEAIARELEWTRTALHLQQP